MDEGNSRSYKNKYSKYEEPEQPHYDLEPPDIVEEKQDIVLRDYQQECVDIINKLDPGSYLVVMSMGLGKTVVFSHIDRPGRMLILSHREELVYQPRKYFTCSYGVERAEETSNGEDVVSASVQSLIRRLDKFKPDDFDIIITDEAHHAVAPSYRKIYDYFKPRLHLGFTATPNRADKNYLGDIYSKIIYNKDIKWGIANGYLCDVECMKVNVGYDLSKVHVRMGDYANNELEDAVNIKECNEIIADVYKNYHIGKTLIFAASVAHAEAINELIPEAEVITCSTENRSQILKAFQCGNVECLINNLILTEGTDIPEIETIIFARPTKNISLYTQAVGRGLRLCEGKKKFRLIDCVGSSSLDICTAPMLFGIDPEMAKKAEEDEGLLSTMEERIGRKQEDMFFNDEYQDYNVQLVDMFTGGGSKYNIHGINFIVAANTDLVVSVGDMVSARVTAEDSVGKCNYSVYDRDTVYYSEENVDVQYALDKVHEILRRDYSRNECLWDRKCVEKWGRGIATYKQISTIKKLYDKKFLKEHNVDFSTLTKFQASVMINRKISEFSNRYNKR